MKVIDITAGIRCLGICTTPGCCLDMNFRLDAHEYNKYVEHLFYLKVPVYYNDCSIKELPKTLEGEFGKEAIRVF